MPSELPVNEVPEGAWLLDVREQDEWDAGHIADSVHIPMSELMSRVDEVPKDRPIVVVCKVGGRSAQVAGYLERRGWADVHNLSGGLVTWVDAEQPLVTDSGAPPQVI